MSRAAESPAARALAEPPQPEIEGGPADQPLESALLAAARQQAAPQAQPALAPLCPPPPPLSPAASPAGGELAPPAVDQDAAPSDDENMSSGTEDEDAQWSPRTPKGEAAEDKTCPAVVETPRAPGSPVVLRYVLPPDFVAQNRWDERCFVAGHITPKIQALRPSWRVGGVIRQQLKNHDALWIIRAEREAHYHALLLLQWVIPPDALTNSQPTEYAIGNFFAVKRVSDMKDFSVEPVPGITEGRQFSLDFGCFRDELSGRGVQLSDDLWSAASYSAARESGKPFGLPPLLVTMAKEHTSRYGTQYRRGRPGVSIGGLPRHRGSGPKPRKRAGEPPANATKRVKREMDAAVAAAATTAQSPSSAVAVPSDDEYNPMEGSRRRRNRNHGSEGGITPPLTPQSRRNLLSSPLPVSPAVPVAPLLPPAATPPSVPSAAPPPTELRGEKIVMPWLRGQLAAAGEDAHEAAIKFAVAWQQAHSHPALAPIMKDFEELLALVSSK